MSCGRVRGSDRTVSTLADGTPPTDARVESDQPEGTIADVYQPGYEMGGSVIEAARVTVSDGE